MARPEPKLDTAMSLQAVPPVTAGHRYFSEKITEAASVDQGAPLHQAALKSPIARLSPRDRQMLQLVAEGKTSAEIDKMLYLSPKSVETCRSRLMQKIGVSDLTALIEFAIQHGLAAPG